MFRFVEESNRKRLGKTDFGAFYFNEYQFLLSNEQMILKYIYFKTQKLFLFCKLKNIFEVDLLNQNGILRLVMLTFLLWFNESTLNMLFALLNIHSLWVLTSVCLQIIWSFASGNWHTLKQGICPGFTPIGVEMYFIIASLTFWFMSIL